MNLLGVVNTVENNCSVWPCPCRGGLRSWHTSSAESHPCMFPHRLAGPLHWHTTQSWANTPGTVWAGLSLAGTEQCWSKMISAGKLQLQQEVRSDQITSKHLLSHFVWRTRDIPQYCSSCTRCRSARSCRSSQMEIGISHQELAGTLHLRGRRQLGTTLTSSTSSTSSPTSTSSVSPTSYSQFFLLGDTW